MDTTAAEILAYSLRKSLKSVSTPVSIFHSLTVTKTMISTNKKTVVADIPQPFNRQGGGRRSLKSSLLSPSQRLRYFTQSDIRQISPPVFRPQSAPSAVQPKLANGVVRQKTPIAPLVYRPQPLPKVLQKKSGATELPQTVQSPRQPIAPPVYAPVAKKIAQPKLRTAPKAPPVYRPTQGGIAQPKLATARPADKLPKAPSVYQVEPKQLSLQPSQPLQKKSRAVTPQASAPRTARQKKEFSAARALTPHLLWPQNAREGACDWPMQNQTPFSGILCCHEIELCLKCRRW
ncbi:MAG: hypothetical protein U0X75_01795 [Acidobacteriota bacterium]